MFCTSLILQSAERVKSIERRVSVQNSNPLSDVDGRVGALATEWLKSKVGSPTWIRTTINGSKGRCPTVRRSGNETVNRRNSV
jgi:hypothetical protein